MKFYPWNCLDPFPPSIRRWAGYYAYALGRAVDLSDRDNKKTLLVKEEGTYDADTYEEAEAEVVKLLKEPQLLVEPPPESSMSPPGTSV